jgi:hypothetical protein
MDANLNCLLASPELAGIAMVTKSARSTCRKPRKILTGAARTPLRLRTDKLSVMRAPGLARAARPLSDLEYFVRQPVNVGGETLPAARPLLAGAQDARYLSIPIRSNHWDGNLHRHSGLPVELLLGSYRSK